jgi:septal ring factor EnvC (AmiA/AmiB activator)
MNLARRRQKSEVEALAAQLAQFNDRGAQLIDAINASAASLSDALKRIGDLEARLAALEARKDEAR